MSILVPILLLACLLFLDIINQRMRHMGQSISDLEKRLADKEQKERINQ